MSDALLGYTIRLENQIENQKKALRHWREKADLDYVRIQRMYNALLSARKHIPDTDEHFLVLGLIEDAISCVNPAPPERFK